MGVGNGEDLYDLLLSDKVRLWNTESLARTTVIG
jgi:hypothetical protein